MAKKKRIPHKFHRWIEARKKAKLSNAHIQMARELGMNPKRLVIQAAQSAQPWRLPLPAYIEACYEEKYGKKRPDEVKSIEAMAEEHVARREARKAANAEKDASEASVEPSADAPAEPSADAPDEPSVDAPAEPRADAPDEPSAIAEVGTSVDVSAIAEIGMSVDVLAETNLEISELLEHAETVAKPDLSDEDVNDS
ncbi:MAG: hypothetical protein AB8B91_02620 [Rubripirellula sp.]